MTSAGIIGQWLGAIFAGIYADRFGRRNAVLVFSSLMAALSILQGILSNEYGFIICRILVMACSVSQYSNHSCKHLNSANSLHRSLDIRGRADRTVKEVDSRELDKCVFLRRLFWNFFNRLVCSRLARTVSRNRHFCSDPSFLM